MVPALLAAMTGVVHGARHALEPDHVTAVATVMVEAPTPRRGLFYAGCWGLGHAAMLVLVAGPLVVLRVELPSAIMTALEVGVGIMLVYLGVRTLRHRARAVIVGGSGSVIERGRRPFAIGVMHGLAGSGALAALLALGTPTITGGLLSLGLYAVGTIAGMVGLAALAGPVIARAGKLPRVTSLLAPIAGVASILVGIAWTIRTLAGV